VFKPPRKDFACETFVIKNYEKFNGEEEKRAIKQTEERISGVCSSDEVLNVTFCKAAKEITTLF